jgi:hypothetical protein
MSELARVIEDVVESSVDALRQLCYATPDFAKRYEGWEVIGRGGFATVVKVSLMGEPVALKIFTNLNEEGRERFRSEFASTVRLNSLHLVRTYSAFDTGSIAWIEMEAVDGPNLEHELARRELENEPFAIEEALEIGIALATVVAEAHEQGIVHRDIKPANVLLPRSKRPVAKLGDFGIARFVDAAKLTATGGFPGTPKWAAPEVFALKPLVGPPADVYSLSLCLFALFTNNRYAWVLGEDVSPGSFMAAHLKSRPVRMKFFERTIPEALDAIVAQGLEKRASGRPTASDIARSLSSYRSDLGVKLTPIESHGATATVTVWRRIRVGAVALVGALGLVALAWAIGGPRQAVRVTKADVAASPTVSLALNQPLSMVQGSAATETATATVDLRLSVGPTFVRIQNGHEQLSELAIVLVDKNDRHHAYRFPGTLSSLGSAEIALEAFIPAVTTEPLREAQVSAAAQSGRREARILIEGE